LNGRGSPKSVLGGDSRCPLSFYEAKNASQDEAALHCPLIFL